MTVDVHIAIRAECHADAVLIDLIARSKYVNEVTRRAVIPQHGISPLTVDIQIAVRPKRQPGRFSQAIARSEHINELSGSPVIPENRVRAITADVQIPVRTDREAARSH